MREWPSGHLKLAWTRQLLKLRTELADVFTDGDYAPLEVTGQHRNHFIAFARRRGREAAIVVVPRGSLNSPTGAETGRVRRCMMRR